MQQWDLYNTDSVYLFLADVVGHLLFLDLEEGCTVIRSAIDWVSCQLQMHLLM